MGLSFGAPCVCKGVGAWLEHLCILYSWFYVHMRSLISYNKKLSYDQLQTIVKTKTTAMLLSHAVIETMTCA